MLNLKEDMIGRSNKPLSDPDIIEAGTFYEWGLVKLQEDVSGFYDNLEMFASLFGGLPGVAAAAALYVTNKIQDTLTSAVKASKDIFLWLVEGSDSKTLSFLSTDIKTKVDAHFKQYGQSNRARPTVAAGYSGGFVPMAEALALSTYNESTQTGYNVSTLVAIGAATSRVSDIAKDLLIKMMQATEIMNNPYRYTTAVIKSSLEALNDSVRTITGQVGFTVSVIQDILDFIMNAAPKSAQDRYTTQLKAMGVPWDTLFEDNVLNNLTVNPNLNTIVNLYGSKDILATTGTNGHTIGGYRNELAGFTPADRNHTLVNIEILGATHFDYMRREESLATKIINNFTQNDEWNVTVANFVTDVILNSQDGATLDAYLQERSQEFVDGEPIAKLLTDGKWQIRLPGWKQRI